MSLPLPLPLPLRDRPYQHLALRSLGRRGRVIRHRHGRPTKRWDYQLRALSQPILRPHFP